MIIRAVKTPVAAMAIALSTAVVLVASCVNPHTSQPAADETTQTVSDDREATLADKQASTASTEVNVLIIDEARDSNLLDQVMQGVNNIYQQCGISVSYQSQQVDLTAKQVIDRQTRTSLVEQYKDDLITLFFVPRTAEADVAYAYIPSRGTPLASSIWITERVQEACLPWIAAHEIGHVLLDSGKHSNGSSYVMSNGCTVNNWSNSAASPKWTVEQCLTLRQSPFITDKTKTTVQTSTADYSQ